MVLGFIHVRLDEMGMLEDAVSLDDVQVNAVRTAAAPAVVHRASLFVPGVEYVIADLQLRELLKGVICGGRERSSLLGSQVPRGLCDP